LRIDKKSGTKQKTWVATEIEAAKGYDDFSISVGRKKVNFPENHKGKGNLRKASKNNPPRATAEVRAATPLTSEYRGVYWTNGRWVARFQAKKWKWMSPIFDEAKDAAEAYDDYVASVVRQMQSTDPTQKVDKRFAKLNFPSRHPDLDLGCGAGRRKAGAKDETEVYLQWDEWKEQAAVAGQRTEVIGIARDGHKVRLTKVVDGGAVQYQCDCGVAFQRQRHHFGTRTVCGHVAPASKPPAKKSGRRGSGKKIAKKS
jgi:hypothetical protein